MYASSKKVARIFINGNVIKDGNEKRVNLNAAYFRSLHLGKSVKAMPSKKNKSINNKFNPLQGIATDAVFLADENVSQKLNYERES